MYNPIYDGYRFDVVLIKTTSAQSEFWKGYNDEDT